MPTQCQGYFLLAAERIADKSYVEAMRKLIRDHDYCASGAVQVIGSIGPPASEAIPDILSSIHGTSEYYSPFEYSTWAMKSVVQIGTAAVPSLIKMSEESDLYRRRWAFEVLYRLSDQDPRATNAVLDEMKKPRSSIFTKWEVSESLRTAIRSQARELFASAHSIPGILQQALPINPAVLFPANNKRGIQVTLTAAKHVFRSSERIDLAIRLANRSNRKQRVLIPNGCSAAYPDPAHLFIFQESGWPLNIQNHMMYDLGMGPPDGGSTLELKPMESKEFSCNLQAPDEKLGLKSFDYQNIGIRTTKPQQLVPGRYRIWARYSVDDHLLNSPFFWSAALTAKLGQPWTGEIFSNELNLRIK